MFFSEKEENYVPLCRRFNWIFTEDEKGCCCCCFCCCCLLLYVKETAGSEGISPVTLLPLVDGQSTPPQTAPCIESATSSLLFHKEWWLIYNLMHVDRKREYHKISEYQASWCMNMNFILTLLFLKQYISWRTPSQCRLRFPDFTLDWST